MPGSSVLCILEDNLDLSNPLIAAAQSEAIKLKLPMAVVHCVSKNEHTKVNIGALGIFESELKSRNIPLLVMIGDRKTRIAAAVHHLDPALIIDSSAEKKISTLQPLRVHDYDWPGTIISTNELLTMNDYTC